MRLNPQKRHGSVCLRRLYHWYHLTLGLLVTFLLEYVNSFSTTAGEFLRALCGKVSSWSFAFRHHYNTHPSDHKTQHIHCQCPIQRVLAWKITLDQLSPFSLTVELNWIMCRLLCDFWRSLHLYRKPCVMATGHFDLGSLYWASLRRSCVNEENKDSRTKCVTFKDAQTESVEAPFALFARVVTYHIYISAHPWPSKQMQA